MFDYLTLMNVFVAVMITNIVIFLTFHKFSNINFSEFIFWLISFVLHTIGLAFYIYNTSHFSIYLIMVQNICILTAVLFMIFGVNALLNKKIEYKFAFLSLIYLSLIVMELFISITTNQRIMIIAIMNIMMYLIAIYYTFRVKINIHVRFIKNLKLVLFLFVVINLFRITSSLLNLENTYFVRNWLNSVIIIFGICLHIGLTFAILYIIYGRNQYKFVDLEYKYQKKIAISKSEEKFQQLFEQMPLGIAIHQLLYDDHGKAINYRFLNVNHSYEEHTTLKAKDIIGKTLYEVIPDDAPIWLKKYTNVVKNKSVISFVDYSKPLNSYFNIVVYPIEEDKFVTIVNNITKDIHKDQELEFLVTHDYLTKLKNRQEFLKDLKTYNEIEGISTKLILMDIDGFSVFNDAFGNDVGDSILVLMSNNIVEYLKSDFNVYRVGGDSFAILLNNSQKNIDDFIKKLQAKISKIHYKDINVSVTFAYGERNNRIQNVQTFISSVEKVLIKNKSIKEKSHYSQRIVSILEILTTKYEDEKEHSKQVRNICGKIGEVLGLSEKQINELKLSGHLHDIGKIAIPEEILHKPAKLTEDEYEIVKTHAEIGYRILNSVEEYQNVAIATLHHHERYDGFGYPKGLKGEDIPLFSRIICIVDAYEAMVSDRVYRKALGKSFAIEELKRCSGTQFDPFIVDVFIEHIEQF